MRKSKPVVALTSGEPAGIGPELCRRVAREAFAARLVVIGDRSLLAGCAQIEHVPLARPSVPGRLDAANGLHIDLLPQRIPPTFPSPIMGEG